MRKLKLRRIADDNEMICAALVFLVSAPSSGAKRRTLPSNAPSGGVRWDRAGRALFY